MTTPRLTLDRVRQLRDKLANWDHTGMDYPFDEDDEIDMLAMAEDLLDARREKPECLR